MATHDYVIANGTGAAVRSDLNGALAAIVSQNSSATEPSPSYAYQRWADTTAGVMKMRNGANNAWITLYQLDGEWSTIAFENGTAAAPSIYFKDSGTDTGIYSPGADQVAISTGGTGRVFVSSTGLGVGTTPGYKLDVNGEVAFSPNTAGKNTFYFTTNASNDGSLFLKSDTTNKVNIQANGTSYFNGGNVGIGTTSAGSFGFFAVRGSAALGGSYGNVSAHFSDGATTSLYIKHAAGEIGYFTDGAVAQTFYTSSTARASIDSSGRLLVGVIASPAYQLEVSTDSAGKPSSALWTIVSDERIKEDIELADLDLCYEAIKAIPLKRYKWRDDIYTAEQVTDRRKLGWIAQDVEAIFPKAVGTHEFKYNQVFEETIIPAVEEELDADGNVITPAQPERIEQGDLISEDVIEDCRDLNSDQLYAAMYGAVQKLIAKVETLEASNADLLVRVSALESA